MSRVSDEPSWGEWGVGSTMDKQAKVKSTSWPYSPPASNPRRQAFVLRAKGAGLPGGCAVSLGLYTGPKTT